MTQDQEIRDGGFTVEERPKHGPAIWRRGRRTYTEADALRISRNEKPDRDELRELERAKRGK